MNLIECRKAMITHRSESLAYRVFVRTMYENGSTVYDVKLSRGDETLQGTRHIFDNQLDALCRAREMNEYCCLEA